LYVNHSSTRSRGRVKPPPGRQGLLECGAVKATRAFPSLAQRSRRSRAVGACQEGAAAREAPRLSLRRWA
jgi:hypothetical protein